jgi:hypothetical protein
MKTRFGPILRSAAFTALAGLLAAGNALACYTVYDRANTIVYHAQTPPVDMSSPFSDRLQRVFPGGHLVFGSGADCPIKQAGYNPARLPAATSPLFTDSQTAQEMKLAHTVLPNGTAMVPKPPKGMRSGFTVMNLGGGGTTEGRTDKPLAARSKSGPVITEMRDPPVTIIEQDGRVQRQLRE